MYIEDSKELARALQPFLESRVLVRCSVQGWGKVSYTAELIILLRTDGDEYLYQAQISLLIERGLTQIESDFTEIGLKHKPDSLEDIARRWLGRRADDWCHAEQFMGAYEIFRDRQFHTSVKIPPVDPRWHLLFGAILAELRAKRQERPRSDVDARGIRLLEKRFSAFAAESISVWADQTLSAH